MAKFRDILSSFLVGEVTPKAHGRADIDEFRQSCERVENLIVQSQGGVIRRPGTQHKADFVDEGMLVAPLSAGVRLIPFIVSKTQSYVVIVTTYAADTTADPNDNGIYIWDVTNQELLTITYDYLDDPNYDIVQFVAYTTQDMLNELTYVQYGNAIFFAQGNRIPWALEFRGSPGFYNFVGAYFMPFWAYSRLGIGGDVPSSELVKAWPYEDSNTTDVTLTVSNASGGSGKTITASENLVNIPGNPIDRGCIGSPIRVTGDSATKTGVTFIVNTSLFGPTFTGINTVAWEDTNATTTWAMAAWNNDAGWPRIVTFYQQRIVYLGSERYRNGVWASRQFQLGDMRQEHFVQDSPNTLTDDDPFNFDVAGVPTITWASPGKNLSFGSEDREYIVTLRTQEATFGALLQFSLEQESSIGGSNRMPVRVDNAVLFAQWSGKRIRQFLYNETEDSYKSTDIMDFSEHIITRQLDNIDQSTSGAFLDPVIEQFAFQNSDNPIVWFIDTNGGLCGLTRDASRGINAYHFHKLGGSNIFGGESYNAIVKSICTLPSPDGIHSDLWMAVLRFVGGDYVMSLEKMGRQLPFNTVVNDFTSLDYKMCYMDSAVLLTEGTATNSFTVAHLPSSTVTAVADGFYVGELETDASGVFVLPNSMEANEVIVGLPYTSILKSSDLNRGSIIGTAQTVPKSVDTLVIRVDKTIGAKVGTSLQNLEDLVFRPAGLDMDTPIPLFTGDKDLTFNEGWEGNINVHVVQDKPLPMNVLALVTRGTAND